MIKIVIFAVWVSCGLCQPLNAGWPQFRGNNSDGIGTGAPPVEFGPGKNELWSTPLQPGHSSPCIAGQRIFVTTYDKGSLALGVICLSRDNGEVLWKKTIEIEKLVVVATLPLLVLAPEPDAGNEQRSAVRELRSDLEP